MSENRPIETTSPEKIAMLVKLSEAMPGNAGSNQAMRLLGALRHGPITEQGVPHRVGLYVLKGAV